MKKLLALLKAKGATDAEIKEIEDEIEAEKSAATEAEVAGLKKKRDELIKKNKELSGEEGGKVADLEAKIEELTTANATLDKAAKAAEMKRAAAEKERDEKVGASETAIQQLLIDGGLTSALAGKVKPAHLEAVKGLLSRSFVVESDGTVRKAVAVTKDKDGKEKKIGVDDYLKEWFAGDIGKEFAIDQGGTGGGAGGSGAGGAGPTGKRARYEALNAKKQEELTGPEKLELVVLAGDPANTKPA